MTRRTLRLGGAAVTVEVPTEWLAPLRRLRYKDALDGELGRLVVRAELPRLQVHARDVETSMLFWRVLHNNPTGAGHRRQGGKAIQRVTYSDLQDRVHSVSWYQTIELPDGVVTPGVYDHRPLVPHYGIPASLVGKRVLDVASSDGFWAFEFERRGALEVVSLDLPLKSNRDFPPELRAQFISEGLDGPTASGFDIARAALGSGVQRLEGSVYDLDPDVHGSFDFVHASDILLHLEDPFRALRAIRSICSGQALLVDCFDNRLSGQTATYLGGGWRIAEYWLPSLDVLGQMVLDCGFAAVELHRIYNLAAADEPSGDWRAALLASV